MQNCVDKIFLEYDKDNSGFLDFEESEVFFRDFCKMMRVNKFEPKLIEKLFKQLDSDGDGRLSKEEIFKMVEDCL